MFNQLYWSRTCKKEHEMKIKETITIGLIIVAMGASGCKQKSATPANPASPSKPTTTIPVRTDVGGSDYGGGLVLI